MIYPSTLANFLKKYPKYIPYRNNDPQYHLKLYRRYWIDSSNEIIKVMDVYDLDGDEYYFVKANTAFFHILPYPVNPTHELAQDNKKMFMKESILNDDKWYSGAEIKFWFFCNLSKFINSNYSRDLHMYFDMNSRSLIKDDKYYKVFTSKNRIKLISSDF